jgi:hypothetical protein
MFAGAGGGPSVDEDKVAEGLKKLRSLDEPLGPIPNSMPTLKEGMPVVPGLPVPVVTPGVAAADLARSRGTSHGHALSTPGMGQGLVPMAVDDRLKGTLLGHSLHLPDLPAVPEENRAPEVRAIAVAPRPTPPGTHLAGDHTDFSHGDARFFESQPLNTELEPEHPRSTKVVRIAIFTAVISVFVVGLRLVSRPQGGQPQPPRGAPAAADRRPRTPASRRPPVAGARRPPVERRVPLPRAPHRRRRRPPQQSFRRPHPTTPAPAAAADPAEEIQRRRPLGQARARGRRASDAGSPPPHHGRNIRRRAITFTGRHQTRGHPGKHGKVVEDPDGTLPLSE